MKTFIEFILSVRFFLFKRYSLTYTDMTIVERTIFSSAFFKLLINDVCAGIDGLIAEYRKVKDKPLGGITVARYIEVLEDMKKRFAKQRVTRLPLDRILSNFYGLADSLEHSLGCHNEYVLIDGKRIDFDLFLERPCNRLRALTYYQRLFNDHRTISSSFVKKRLAAMVIKTGNKLLSGEAQSLWTLKTFSETTSMIVYSQREFVSSSLGKLTALESETENELKTA